MLDGLYHWGLSKYDVRSCVSRVRMCRQVGHRSTQIENRIIIFQIVNCWGNEKIDSYYLLSNLILLMNFSNITCKKNLPQQCWWLWMPLRWTVSVYLKLLNNQIPQKWNTYHNDFKDPPPLPRLVCFVQLLGVSPSCSD